MVKIYNSRLLVVFNNWVFVNITVVARIWENFNVKPIINKPRMNAVKLNIAIKFIANFIVRIENMRLANSISQIQM